MFDTKFWAVTFFALSSAGLAARIHLAIRSGELVLPAPRGTQPITLMTIEQPRLFWLWIALECLLAGAAFTGLLFVALYW